MGVPPRPLIPFLRRMPMARHNQGRSRRQSRSNNSNLAPVGPVVCSRSDTPPQSRKGRCCSPRRQHGRAHQAYCDEPYDRIPSTLTIRVVVDRTLPESPFPHRF